MGAPSHETTVPRGALLGAAALITFTMAAALFGRLSGATATPLPPAHVIVSSELRFSDRADGAVEVTRVDGRPVTVIAPGTNGFVRGVLRGLAQERLRRHEGADRPFELTRWSDGRLSLTDPLTNRHVYLDAFGPTNVAAFAAILDADARHE
jgi:putative photosynthetic complex assembly protein